MPTGPLGCSAKARDTWHRSVLCSYPGQALCEGLTAPAQEQDLHTHRGSAVPVGGTAGTGAEREPWEGGSPESGAEGEINAPRGRP